MVGDEAHVWDLWPAEESFPAGLTVLAGLDPRAPDLEARYGRRPGPGVHMIRPMTLYFPKNRIDVGGYWLSVFTGTDARPYLRPEEADLRHEPGLVYYRAYLEQGEPPFRVDSLIPAAVEVPRPGAHPDPTASTAGGLFPSPVRVAGPGILPPPES